MIVHVQPVVHNVPDAGLKLVIILLIIIIILLLNHSFHSSHCSSCWESDNEAHVAWWSQRSSLQCIYLAQELVFFSLILVLNPFDGLQHRAQHLHRPADRKMQVIMQQKAPSVVFMFLYRSTSTCTFLFTGIYWHLHLQPFKISWDYPFNTCKWIFDFHYCQKAKKYAVLSRFLMCCC